ncbi:MAG: glycine betaine ABC transporter substrate-binding protein [Coriobacteriia bacterium]|nr:glycine betaine ABC transporter substrate-binding protein [Coriobacteriia bacterium]
MLIARGKGLRLALGLMLAVVLLGTSAALGGCDAAESTGGEGGTKVDPIEIGWVPWDEAVAVTFLWSNILESEGYDVNLTQVDIAPLYAGIAEGDLDLYLDAWLPLTHGDYAAEYDEGWEYLGVWNDNGVQNWTVPDYVDPSIVSLEDLKGNADMFEGRIVGIEPGGGLMRMSKEDVIPGYGLEEYELIEGSTSAMLAELDRATRNEEPIVVLLWHPHWAYEVFGLRDLEDPKQLMSVPEEMHVVAHKGFTEEYPEVAEWLGDFEMSDEEISNLVNVVMNDYGQGREAEAVEAWLDDPDNRALVDGWIGK